MKKQKICIIGGGLTGLVTAISLSKLDYEIDLITGNSSHNLQNNGTIAISENNLNFLNKLNISKSLKENLWPCTKMKLYTEIKNQDFLEVFELNKESSKKKILYMLENSKIIKLLINKIKNIKSISVKKNKKILSISTSGLLKSVKFEKGNSNSKYNLIIICVSHGSSLIKKLFNNKVIKNSYGESAITTVLAHSRFKNNIARQIFLDNEILALLPISHTKTAIVWSVKNSLVKRNKIFIKNKIKLYAKNYLKNIKFETNIESKDLNLLIRNKYYLDRILLFGDALHVMHPFIGQGFNMTLRDLASLEKILIKKENLGLDIGSKDVLSEFSSKVKPRNFSFSIASDLLKSSLNIKRARNDVLKILSKSDFAKNLLFNLADKGFKF